MFLELSWLMALVINVVPFGLYILYVSRVAQMRPWDISIDTSYEPAISVMIPTFNEEIAIRRKLDNLMESNYPKERISLIIIDGASKDRTIELVQKWSEEHPQTKIRIVRQGRRSGMVNGLNEGLKYADAELVVKTDADCLWLKDSLRNAIKYIADPRVGSVAGVHIIDASRQTYSVRTERTYRRFYSLLRVGESKLYGTVLYEGELMVVRRELLETVGFDEEIGGDDVPMALRMAERGFRAITAEDSYFVEQTPYSWSEKLRQKVRRGRHVFQALWKYRYLNFRNNTPFHRLILPFETYIYVLNPFVTMLVLMLSVGIFWRYPILLTALIPLLLIGRIREMLVTHLIDSAIMVYAILKEIGGREKVTWDKIAEAREHLAVKPNFGRPFGKL